MNTLSGVKEKGQRMLKSGRQPGLGHTQAGAAECVTNREAGLARLMESCPPTVTDTSYVSGFRNPLANGLRSLRSLHYNLQWW